jgi:hypothetical protein
MPNTEPESLPAQIAGAVNSEIAELERDAKETVRRRTVSSLLDVDHPSHPAAPKVQSSKPLLWKVELWDQDHSIPIHNLNLGRRSACLSCCCSPSCSCPRASSPRRW